MPLLRFQRLVPLPHYPAPLRRSGWSWRRLAPWTWQGVPPFWAPSISPDAASDVEHTYLNPQCRPGPSGVGRWCSYCVPAPSVLRCLCAPSSVSSFRPPSPVLLHLPPGACQFCTVALLTLRVDFGGSASCLAQVLPLSPLPGASQTLCTAASLLVSYHRGLDNPASSMPCGCCWEL